MGLIPIGDFAIPLQEDILDGEPTGVGMIRGRLAAADHCYDDLPIFTLPSCDYREQRRAGTTTWIGKDQQDWFLLAEERSQARRGTTERRQLERRRGETERQTSRGCFPRDLPPSSRPSCRVPS